MPDINSLEEQIFSVNDLTFDHLALEVFKYQFDGNPIYRSFVQALGKSPNEISTVNQIPFLPIEFFKTQNVKTGEWNTNRAFESSGTTKKNTSKHYVFDESFYLDNCLRGFEDVYGAIEDYSILALLPSYLERSNSGLVAMANYFIQKTGQAESGFLLDEFEILSDKLKRLKAADQKVILLGVTFALLDFAESFQLDFPDLIIMETGGMKGRREEMVREDVHNVLRQAFGVKRVHSEYGMTELFSQAYSKGEGVFRPSRTMKVISRDLNDPLSYPYKGRNGGLNIIDLANYRTCSFIETKDMGLVHADGSFEVNGRIDNAELRGCNLMVF